MKPVTLFDSELKLMELLWKHQPVTAKQLTLLAAEALGWNKNTTYTVIKKLVDKQAVKRTDPDFVCTALLNKETIQKAETDSLIQKLFSGSRKAFFSAFLQDETLSSEELEALRAMIDGKEQNDD